jgi:hypothetical protein
VSNSPSLLGSYHDGDPIMVVVKGEEVFVTPSKK